MIDREKVMRGLERCAKGNCPFSEEYKACEYTVGMYCGKKRLMMDALELLKAQEPRVMTPQELMELPHGPRDKVPICVEERAPVNVWNESLFKWCGSDFAQEQYREHGGYYTAETYGRLWRCWTGMPTRKEREAVKWDG